MNVLWLISAIAGWGAIHSILASLAAKEAARRGLGPGAMRLYRLGYNIFAVVSFLPVLWLMAMLPDRGLYHVPPPWSYLMLAGQGLAALLLLAGVLQTDTLSFFGLRQIIEVERPSRLVTGGLYRYVRHPLYTAGLLFLWLTPVMSLNVLTLDLSLTVYILIGAWFEERKLLREYGDEYAEYRRRTPMLIPGLRAAKE